MMDDFDADGNVRSSIPVQFLGQVWTPNLTKRFAGYPSWFDEHDEHPDHVDMPFRKRRSLPVRVLNFVKLILALFFTQDIENLNKLIATPFRLSVKTPRKMGLNLRQLLMLTVQLSSVLR